MKNTTNMNKKNIDAIAEARKYKEFQLKPEDADLKLRLAVEIYNQREKLGLSQQGLAEKMNSTQKTISKIENGDVNIGIDLLNRLAIQLNFDSETLARIFQCHSVYVIKNVDVSSCGSENADFEKTYNHLNSNNYLSIR